MTTPTRDELALYAIGHHEGDAAELERRVDEDPEAAALLAEEVGFASLLRAAVRDATFCPRCHDLVERAHACDAMAAARRARRATWPVVLAAATLAAAVALVLATRDRGDDEPPPETAVMPVSLRIAVDALPVAPPPEPIDDPIDDPPAAPPVEKRPPRPAKPISNRVKVSFVTRPAGVAVVLDGQYHGLTPLVIRVPRSSTPGTLSLRHVGYLTLTRPLALSSDIAVEAVLEPTGAPVPHEGRFADDQCMQCHRPR